MSAWFLHPAAWPILGLAIVVCVLLMTLRRRRLRRLRATLGRRWDQLAPRRRGGWAWFGAGTGLALIALLQPLGAETTRRVEERGIDILFCLDVSNSMFARDAAPHRLEAAKREITDLLERAPGDRFGLVVFAGDARLIAPLTRDRASMRQLLASASPLSVETGGTDLSAALERAGQALTNATGEHESIVLLTDGEDHGGRGALAAQTLSARGISVHAVGVGSVRGAKIPMRGGRHESYLRDRAGQDVISALDTRGLTDLARAGNGTYRTVNKNGTTLRALYDDALAPLARKSMLAREKRARENRYQWPLLLAFLCWIMDLWRGSYS